ncbi:MAG TPA: DUF2382 domain-containing protein [Thermoanaerobaculia bacterium]|jgi:uncharacterized protein (TIGR02271 family)
MASKKVTERRVIPVVQEEAVVGKRRVDRGAVRISRVITEHEETIPTSTIEERVEIERVARNEWIDAPLEPRQDGDTLIIPVIEEVTVVEKRLLLREEIHVRKKKVEKRGEEKIVLRREDVKVERD